MRIIKCRLLTAYGTSDWASNATNGIAKIIRRAVIGLIFPRTWKAAKMQERLAIELFACVCVWRVTETRIGGTSRKRAQWGKSVVASIYEKGSYSRQNRYGISVKARNNVDNTTPSRCRNHRAFAARDWNARGSQCLSSMREKCDFSKSEFLPESGISLHEPGC